MDGEWLVDTSQEQIKVIFVENINFRILDHRVKLKSGVAVYVPMRVVNNNDGSEMIFTLFQTPKITDEMIKKDIKMVENDLNHLKAIIE